MTWPLPTPSGYATCQTRCPGWAGHQSGFILGRHHLLSRGPRSWGSSSCSGLATSNSCRLLPEEVKCTFTSEDGKSKVSPEMHKIPSSSHLCPQTPQICRLVHAKPTGSNSHFLLHCHRKQFPSFLNHVVNPNELSFVHLSLPFSPPTLSLFFFFFSNIVTKACITYFPTTSELGYFINSTKM